MKSKIRKGAIAYSRIAPNGKYYIGGGIRWSTAYSALRCYQLMRLEMKAMGLTYADLQLTNLFNRQTVKTRALVDTGATFMCVTEEVAMQLGFDTTEVSQQVVTLADGHQRKVPKIAPVEIAFANRSYVTEAFVLGNECLMGVLPLEAMDLLVDSHTQQLIVNPAHPNYPVAYAK